MSAPHDLTPLTGSETHGSDRPRTRPQTAHGARLQAAVLLLVVTLGALALVSLGSAADRTAPVYRGEVIQEATAPPPPREDYSEPSWEHQEQPPKPPPTQRSNTWLIVTLSVLGVLLLAAIAWLIHRMWALAKPPVEVADLADEDELTALQAQAALQDARARLSTVVGAHDAVIEAWLALERAIAEAGVRRDPSQTTLEFVVAVLGDLSLDRSALDRLAHLYRRALFDPQPLVEADRDEAMEHLDRLRDQLEQGTGHEQGTDAGGTR